MNNKTPYMNPGMLKGLIRRLDKLHRKKTLCRRDKVYMKILKRLVAKYADDLMELLDE